MKDTDAPQPPEQNLYAESGPLVYERPTRSRGPAVAALVVILLCGWLVFHILSKPRTKPAAPAGIPVSSAPARAGGAGRGRLLAVIDPRPYDAVLAQAKGQLARDQALLKNARLDLSRYQNAYEQHAIPEQQLATQQAMVEQDAGIVQLDEGNLAAAQVNVDYTRIVSPIDGRVGLRSTDLGNIVPADGTTGLVTITQLQPITVIFNIAEDDLSRVAEQLAAGRTLRVDALDRSQQHKLAEGTLLTLDNQINPTTGTVRARATFPNLKGELFPNQFVNARLLIKTLTQVILVPASAIQRNNDAAFVYVAQPDSTVQYRDVKVVATEGDAAAVTGVKPGEVLVTDGFDKLQSGSKIVLKQPPAAPVPAVAAQ